MLSARLIRLVLLTVLAVSLSACVSTPPRNIDNVCDIFSQKPAWYKAAKKSSERWGGPIQMPMAIMYQESSFRRKARPKMNYFLFIPTGRASNAYGYSQALKSTWKSYQRETGSFSKDRDNFADAYDFVQWYMDKSAKMNGVSKWDGYAQYLNYHEGQGGYSRGSYRNKTWLINTAKRVDQRAKRYGQQLTGCQDKLKAKSWFGLF